MYIKDLYTGQICFCVHNFLWLVPFFATLDLFLGQLLAALIPLLIIEIPSLVLIGYMNMMMFTAVGKYQ